MKNELLRQTETQNRLNYKSQQICEKIYEEMLFSESIEFSSTIYEKVLQAFTVGFEMGISFASNKRKPVCCIQNGVIIKIYDSIAEAGKKLNIFPNNITRVLTGYGERKCKKAKGYNWKYFELFDFIGKRINI